MVIWDYKNYRLKYESEINLNLLNIKIKPLNKKFFLISSHFSSYLYIYSSQSKKVIFKIDNYSPIYDIFITKIGEIYLIDSFYISALDIKNKIFYRITRDEHFQENSLIVLANNIFICNSKEEIKYLTFSKTVKIKQDKKFVYLKFLLMRSHTFLLKPIYLVI